MMRLASLYERGLGVAQNRQKATTLYLQAAAAGNENAKNALQRLGVK
jgi:TPR repeat protein